MNGDLEVIVELCDLLVYRHRDGRIIIGTDSAGRRGGDLVGATTDWREFLEGGH